MLASVAKTITNTSLRTVFQKYALARVAQQDNGKERAEQLGRAFKSGAVKRDTMLCSRRTSGPLKCPYAGGNCTIKWAPNHCLWRLGLTASQVRQGAGNQGRSESDDYIGARDARDQPCDGRRGCTDGGRPRANGVCAADPRSGGAVGRGLAQPRGARWPAQRGGTGQQAHVLLGDLLRGGSQVPCPRGAEGGRRGVRHGVVAIEFNRTRSRRARSGPYAPIVP